jgi:hypothetical protein
VTVLPLHLRPGAFEWYFSWLEQHRRDLLPLYRVLYANGPNVPDWYSRKLHRRVDPLLRRHGLDTRQIRAPDSSPAEDPGPDDEPALF